MSNIMEPAPYLEATYSCWQGAGLSMSSAAGIRTCMLRVQVRMLIASELPALHRFNSSLLESYVEVSQ